MPTMELTPAEAKMIEEARLQAKLNQAYHRAIADAADHLMLLGDQCAGGRGQEKDQMGNKLGKPWYDAAHSLLTHFKGN